jgi:hypothetical protein
MGSTPASSVIAVAGLESEPWVETIITASPFCKSTSVLFGKRASMRCKSGVPLPRAPPPELAPGAPCDSEFGRAPPAEGELPGCAPVCMPFSRIAIRCAISAGSFFICESDDTLTTTELLLIVSSTVIVLAAGSTDLMMPAILRNSPVTTSSALMSLPAGLRVPRARS